MDWTTLIVGVFTALAGLIGTYISNRKNNDLIAYRIQQLEDKVNKHNNVVERTFKLEGQVTELQHELSDVKGKIA